VRIYKIKGFARFSRSESIDDQSLVDAVDRAARGLVDADLGGGLIKQRIARPGQGRSGGYRTIIAYRTKDRAIFLYGFAKNERANISPDDVRDLRIVGQAWLNASIERLEAAVTDGALEFINDQNASKKVDENE
jgi:hypothetical protein